MENLMDYIVSKGKNAKKASKILSILDSNTKNKALIHMAENLVNNSQAIIEANKIDMEKGKEKGLSKALLDRLLITEKRISDMAEGLREVADLPDPVGEVIKMWKRPNGIRVGQKRVPLGVLGIIYEARPNVTVDAAGLCLKSGNAVILRGGSEAINTNKCIAQILKDSCVQCGLPEGAIELIEVTDREAVNIMLKLNEYIDVLIPRGGKGLIKTVVTNATVPVIETGVGNCHVFVDESADMAMAKDIIVNAKTQRPGVCNAIETILIHQNIAEKFLPYIANELYKHKVELRVCNDSKKILLNTIEDKEIFNYIKDATMEDWSEEYLNFILAVKVVQSIEDAIDHIDLYGTKHSEAIITKDYFNSEKFLNEIDAAAVYVNASTRFTDGSQYGFGAEIGISTQKLHARGPMGVEQLTTIKYIVYGDGQVRI